MIKCNSPFAYCKKCVIDMDVMDSLGGNICCDFAEDLNFQREEILIHCKYAQPADIKAEALKEMPILWKEDIELGIAYFCPHCKVFQCSGKGQCTKCGGEIDWNKRMKYFGKVKWK